jgi:hypothetical protein
LDCAEALSLIGNILSGFRTFIFNLPGRQGEHGKDQQLKTEQAQIRTAFRDGWSGHVAFAKCAPGKKDACDGSGRL